MFLSALSTFSFLSSSKSFSLIELVSTFFDGAAVLVHEDASPKDKSSDSDVTERGDGEEWNCIRGGAACSDGEKRMAEEAL